MFAGRKEELKILEKRYSSGKFEFGYLYGQRRIGKTWLINEFSKNKKSLIFFASDSDDISNLHDFSRAFEEQTNQHLYTPFSTWDEFFQTVARYFGSNEGFFSIDEYPNLVVGRDGKRKKTDVVSKLQNAIDNIFSKTKILFMITGSNVSFMQKEVGDSSAPLYKRNTFELFLSKLAWNEAIPLLDKMPNDDKARILSLTDTYPYYLDKIDISKSFSENLDSLFFERDSLFASDPSKLLTSEIAASGFYVRIMRCLANGLTSISQLSKALNSESGKISMYLDELLKIQAISKTNVFGSSRLTSYKIKDRMCAFYFRFVHGEEERIKLGYGPLIRKREEAAIEEFIHRSFEDLCITYLEYLNLNGELPNYFSSFQNYQLDNSSLGRSIELDIVGAANDDLLVGECKLSSTLKNIYEYKEMLDDVSIEPFSSYKNKHFYILSSSGFDQSFKNVKDDNLHLIDLDMMFLKF